MVKERLAIDVVEALGSVALSGALKAEVPAMYRNVEIKYSKFGVDDFDFEYAGAAASTRTANSWQVLQQDLLLWTGDPYRKLILEFSAAAISVHAVAA